MNVLDNWCKTYGMKGHNQALLILQTLDALPFEGSIYSNLAMGKFVKIQSKSSNHGNFIL